MQKIVNILESETNRGNEDAKANKVDILCENDKSELILIELQYYSEWDFLHRMLFGTSKLITEYLKIGEEYGAVKKIYSINILYFELGWGTDYVYHGTTEFKGLHNQDILQISEGQKTKLKKEAIYQIFPEYYLIKVNNFDDIAKDPLDEWIYYFKNNALPENFIAKGLDEVEAQLKIDSMTTQEKINYEAHMKNLAISKSMLDTARFEGEFESNKKTTINLITNSDFDDEKIAFLVGVKTSWVTKIRAELEESKA
jgi:predicted transposase/invertase (TIGR01784 family)